MSLKSAVSLKAIIFCRHTGCSHGSPELCVASIRGEFPHAHKDYYSVGLIRAQRLLETGSFTGWSSLLLISDLNWFSPDQCLSPDSCRAAQLGYLHHLVSMWKGSKKVSRYDKQRQASSEAGKADIVSATVWGEALIAKKWLSNIENTVLSGWYSTP